MLPQKTAQLINRARRERENAERRLKLQRRLLLKSKRSLKQARENLSFQADDIRSLLEHIPSSVIITSPDGVVEDINFRASQTFGSTNRMAKGRPISFLLPSLENIQSEVTQAAFKKFEIVEMRARRMGGDEFPCELAASLIDIKGRPSIVWMLRDTSQCTESLGHPGRLEAELRQSRVLEALGTMAGGIAHELSTPIQFITDNSHFVQRSLKALFEIIDELKMQVPHLTATATTERHDLTYLKEEVPLALTQSIEGLKRVTEIVLAVKRFSYPAKAVKDENDLNQIIQTIATVSKNQWKYVAELELQLTPDLPRINSNAGELNQAFLNLIVNAAHAIESKYESGQSGKITITTMAIDGGVETRISDTGVGIKREDLTRIFDLFFTTKAPGRGTGQGLALVHSIIAQSHGGEIDVETEQGVGTTFVIRLPFDGIGTEWKMQRRSDV